MAAHVPRSGRLPVRIRPSTVVDGNESGLNEFGVLGPVRVIVGGCAVAFARPQHRDLFGLLLLHANRPVAVEHVIDGMWGGTAPATAPAQVQNMVSAIRSALARTAQAAATLDHPRAGYLLCVDERL